MSVSNKTLSVLLLAAIVVSLGGTFISLNRLGDLPTIGHATDTGTVDLNIESLLSITTADSNAINFGTCELSGPDANQMITINSETVGGLESAGEGDNGGCEGYTEAVPIAVRNNGNVDVEVQMEVNNTGTAEGGTFLNSGDTGSTDSEFNYKLLDDGWVHVTSGDQMAGGCTGNLGPGTGSGDMTDYVAFESTGLINACSDLASGSTANSFLAHFEIVIPDATSEGDSIQITFEASEA